MARVVMMNPCVVALFALLFPPLLLGVVGDSSVTHASLDYGPMITLDQKLYESGRPRGRKLATAMVWCIAKSNVSSTDLQGALDWVCGPLPTQGQVNCGLINDGGSCYQPNDVQSHASWAFNVYFSTHNATNDACDFQGTAQQVTVDPSTATCVYTGTMKEVNGTIGGNGTIIPSPPGFQNTASIGYEPHFLFRMSTAAVLMTYLLV
ncbi:PLASMODESMATA CALLOSE-BINDING PROTEIN 5 [Physcomitrium patens]|uniref:X8 domain-containing protein n=1 Tax=Physcomitrium patens TaxID=3218 RepID=A0A2K1IRV0_PHYPA|nr:glucan endo-1,3-beta-glucosidase 3-like [Physcomitrium patens]PNR32010.1 hypothetical protein PHYPA_026135 [Physcomitrium patens]|eukprot:XP_024359620.1 glucan endo-1,3-beta-glucosidase 3-like [Physcomitrella patens]